MAAKRQPTNSDLAEKLDAMNTIFTTFSETTNRRLDRIEDWRIATEAAAQALKEAGASRRDSGISNKTLAGTVTMLLAAVAALIATALKVN